MKPSLPGKMCTLTSVVQSQHAIGHKQEKVPVLIKYNKALRASSFSARGLCSTEHSSYTCTVAIL